MNTFDLHSLPDLEQEIIKTPSLEAVWEMVDRYCNNLDVDKAEETMWEMLTALVNDDNGDLQEIQSAFWLYENFKVLNKAVFYLQTQLPFPRKTT